MGLPRAAASLFRTPPLLPVAFMFFILHCSGAILNIHWYRTGGSTYCRFQASLYRRVHPDMPARLNSAKTYSMVVVHLPRHLPDNQPSHTPLRSSFAVLTPAYLVVLLALMCRNACKAVYSRRCFSPSGGARCDHTAYWRSGRRWV